MLHWLLGDMFVASSLIAKFLVIAAPIVLFVRIRSIATGLFLIGTIVIETYPLLAIPLGIGNPGSVGATLGAFLTFGAPLCASIGLFWHAVTTPKPDVAHKLNGNAVT